VLGEEILVPGGSNAINPLFVVIGKTRTQIWDYGSGGHHKPHVIYDPKSRPHTRIVSGPKSTSNYDTKELAFGARAGFGFLAGWMEPFLDDHYCSLIYQHIKGFEMIYVVGGGLGRWSGINNFMRYLKHHDPELIRRITPIRHFRFTDYPEWKLRKIFDELN